MKSIAVFILILQVGHHALAISCDSVTVLRAWPRGYNVRTKIRIPEDTDQWTLGVTFSSAVKSLHVWNAKSSTSDNVAFQMTNASYNGRLRAGSIFRDVSFNVQHQKWNVPHILGAHFNGGQLCVNSTIP